jgi:hypothetical protein
MLSEAKHLCHFPFDANAGMLRFAQHDNSRKESAYGSAAQIDEQIDDQRDEKNPGGYRRVWIYGGRVPGRRRSGRR